MLNHCDNEISSLVQSIPAAAGPVLPSGHAQQLNADAIRKKLQRLQHVSKQTHISRLVNQHMA